jgi:hypothetical protein
MSEQSDSSVNEQDYSYPMLMLLSAYKDAEAALLRKDYAGAVISLAWISVYAGAAIHAVERIRDE